MAGTVTVARTTVAFQSTVPTRVHKVIVDWVGDAANGSVPNTSITGLYGWVVRMVTDPGATAPTDNYDITLEDSEGYDALNDSLANRDTANTEQVVPAAPLILAGDYTFKLANNSVNSATGRVVFHIVEAL